MEDVKKTTPALKPNQHAFRKFLWRFFFIAILVIALLVYWFFYNVFSDGYREGVLFKFSRKGDIFKTYEGELVQPGLRSIVGGSINTNNFYFSVTDKALADSLEQVIGKNVKVHYNQFRKTLPWRGDNYNTQNQESGQYIIDRIESVSAAPANSGL